MMNSINGEITRFYNSKLIKILDEDNKFNEELTVELQSRWDKAEETMYVVPNGEIDAIITPQCSNVSKAYILKKFHFILKKKK